MQVTVPIVLIGESPAIKGKGRMLSHGITELNIECLPEKVTLGDFLKVFVDDREVGEQVIHNLGPLETFEFPVDGAGSAKVTFRVNTSGGNYKREFGVAAQMRRRKP